MYQEFHIVYRQLLEAIVRGGMMEKNERTGEGIRMLGCPASIMVDMQAGRLPVPGNRKVFPATAAAEIAWMLSGNRELTWLRQYCRILDKFTDEPGGNTIHNAYGYRWRHHFGRDQIGQALEVLQQDPTDRQVWITAWDPATDGLWMPSGMDTRPRPKNVACPVGFAVNITRGNLNLAVFIRSSDVFVGLPYDVMGYAMLLDAFAVSLDRGPGFLHVTLAHPHVYEIHVDDAFKSFDGGPRVDKPEMPGMSVGDICQDPDAYVASMKEAAAVVRWPEFNPRPEVVQ